MNRKREQSQGTQSNPDIIAAQVAQQTDRINTLTSLQTTQDLYHATGVRFNLKVIPGFKGAFTNLVDINDFQPGTIFLGLELIKKLSDAAAEGLVAHECGHHAPDSVQFQNMMRQDLNVGIVPDMYKETEEDQEAFLQALGVVHNVVADVFLEALVGRYPYMSIRDNLSALYRENLNSLERKMQLAQLPLPSQLLQMVVGEGRMNDKEKHPDVFESSLEDLVAQGVIKQQVYEAFKRLQDRGVMDRLQDMNTISNPLLPQGDRDSAFAQKFQDYRHIYREWLQLLDKAVLDAMKEEEDKKGKEKKKDKKSGKSGKDGDGGSRRFKVEDGKPDPDAEPLDPNELTPEEKEEIMRQIMEKMIKDGESFGSHSPSQEEIQATQDAMQRAREMYKPPSDASSGQPSQGQPGDTSQQSDQQPKSLEDTLGDLARELTAEKNKSNNRSLAESLQIKDLTVKKWEEIKTKYSQLIEEAAELLTEIFKDDRTPEDILFSTQGDIMDGLIAEHIGEEMGGNPEPRTRHYLKKMEDFLKTIIEFIVDTSGSMGGSRIDASSEFLVVIIEIFKRVRENLVKDDLLASYDEQPLQVGATTFAASGPKRVTKPEEPLSDKKELLMLDQISQIGGGTEGASSIKVRYKELKERIGRELKVLMVLTDGYDDANAILPLIDEIVRDQSILMLVVAVGDDSSAVKATYEKALENVEERLRNVIVVEGRTIDDIMRPLIMEKLIPKVLQKRLEGLG